jgi:putative hydrolases of HD superfamily
MNKKIINFLFEAAALKRLKRTGWQILGENEESVAAHSYMVAVISYALAYEVGAKIQKVLTMALFHDFTESRMGDIYKLADGYVKGDVIKAANDAFAKVSFNKDLIILTKEYEDENTLEARIVHDADTLALCLELKQLIERGNIHAKVWFTANKDALRLDISKKIISEIENTDSQAWWVKEREKIHRGFKK